MKNERRNCCDVIQQILNIVPEEEISLIKSLKWCLEDASFKAPEETIQWQRTYDAINDYLINKKESTPEEWEYKMLSIFSTKSVKELKELYES